MKGNMIFGIYGHNETSISSCMAVPFNYIQPIWKKKICINLQKRMLFPQSTKVPLGSNVDFNIHDNISEYDFGTGGRGRGKLVPILKKWYIIMVYAKLNIHRPIV